MKNLCYNIYNSDVRIFNGMKPPSSAVGEDFIKLLSNS